MDCRINGCPVGECIRQGNEFVCRQGKSMFLLSIFYINNENIDFCLNLFLKCHPFVYLIFFLFLNKTNDSTYFNQIY